MGASLRWTALSLAVLCLSMLVRGGSVSGGTSGGGGGSVTVNASCGTCESLGYQCLGANAPKDACGQPIDVGGCAIPSCATYCLVMAGLSGGFCNDNTHQCVCDPDAVVSTVPNANTQDGPDVIIQASPGESPEPDASSPTPTPPALVPKVFHFGAGAIGGTVTQASIAAITIVALGIVAAGKSG